MKRKSENRITSTQKRSVDCKEEEEKSGIVRMERVKVMNLQQQSRQATDGRRHSQAAKQILTVALRVQL